MTNERKQQVLKAIIKHFIDTAEPVGSNTIIVNYNFHVSPATIRNDMATLENDGFIYQPHTPAGRIPTTKGYREYVEKIADIEKAKKEATKVIKELSEEYKTQKAKEYVYDAVQLLSRATATASFATVPDSNRTFYLGLSNVLKQPEFTQNTIHASQVIEMFEHGDNFITTLKSLNVEDETKAFIGEENILEQIQSCGMVVTKYNINGFKGFLGVLGPTRMHYPFNIAMVEQIKTLLENN
ncbi:DeoR family transcriptional regulator [Candidatus Peregrinibacteria bacterium]|nr:DeoR family transcriptional regulator [Candidatus Peregrinibacteria bacterium]